MEFSLAARQKVFVISENNTYQSIAIFQQAVQVGEEITVFYSSSFPWLSGTNGSDFHVYQVEKRSEVIYSLDEVHRKAQRQGALLLILIFIVFTVALGQYLQARD